jgi:hypothetical protein
MHQKANISSPGPSHLGPPLVKPLVAANSDVFAQNSEINAANAIEAAATI